MLPFSLFRNVYLHMCGCFRAPREADNAKLRSLLEPKYRALGVAPPRVPTWSGRRGFGNSSGPGLGSEALNVDGASRRVVTLFQSTPLFEIEGAWVKTSVTVAGSTHRGEKERGSNEALAAASSSLSNAMPPPQTSSLTELQASKTVGAWRHRLALRAAVKSLAEMVSGACEAREEELLKSRLPGVQAYISELEAYRSAIVRGKPLRAVTASCEGGDGVGVRQGSRHMVEIDDDLWRLFAVQETRLYSSPAALGSKPGRVYLTFNTLWFHSKVRNDCVPVSGIDVFVSYAARVALRCILMRSSRETQLCSVLDLVSMRYLNEMGLIYVKVEYTRSVTTTSQTPSTLI